MFGYLRGNETGSFSRTFNYVESQTKQECYEDTSPDAEVNSCGDAEYIRVNLGSTVVAISKWFKSFFGKQPDSKS